MRTLVAFLLLCGAMVAWLIIALLSSSSQPARNSVGGASQREAQKSAAVSAIRDAPLAITADPSPHAAPNPFTDDPRSTSKSAPTNAPDVQPSPRRVRGETRWPDERASLQRQYADATAALSRDPDSRSALRDAIDAALLLRDNDAAFALQQRFIALEPGDVEQLSRAARVALDLARWVDAIELLHQCAARSPEEPRHRFNLAVAHTALGHLHDAQSEWEAYLAIRPNDHDAQFQFGVTLLDLHEWQSASKVFADLIRTDPTQQDVQLNLMMALHRLDRWDDLVEATDDFVARSGPQKVVLNRAAELLWQAAETDGAPRAALLQQVGSYAAASLSLDPEQPAIRGLMQRATAPAD